MRDRQGPGGRVRHCLRGLLLVLAVLGAARPTAAGDAVDVALVLAVDVSYSMDADEQRLQRTGYVTALTAPEVLAAIAAGEHKRIAVTYVEWAGMADQKILVPWRVIDGPAAARAFADELTAQPYRRAARTSIAGALTFALPLFDASGLTATRRVIDISGDGPNNQGIPVTEARARALARGIIINGLPIIWRRARPGLMDIDNLDAYYETCVIGGDGSFMIPIRTPAHSNAATRLKLLQEIAAADPPPARPLRPIPAAAPDVDCLIGEKLWQQRMESIRN